MAMTTEAVVHQLEQAGFVVNAAAGRVFATAGSVELVAHHGYMHWQLYMRATGWSLTSIVRDLATLRELLDVRAPGPELVN